MQWLGSQQYVQYSFLERPEEGAKATLLRFHLCFSSNRDGRSSRKATSFSCPCKAGGGL